MTRAEALTEAIRSLSLVLDPRRQGECWPDPGAWDGRPLEEQARDLLVLADESPDVAVAEAAAAVRRAVHP